MSESENKSPSYLVVPDDEKEAIRYRNLHYKAALARNCKYAAARRFSRLHLLSTYSVCFLSIYLIVLSVMLLPTFLIDDSQKILATALNILNIFLSLFVMIFSLVENEKSHARVAEEFFECAKDLSRLINKIELNRDINIEEQLRKYESILKQMTHDHSDIDYLYACIHSTVYQFGKHGNYRQKTTLYVRYAVKSFINYYTQIGLSIILPPLIVFVIFSLSKR